jgi:cytochrome c5
MRTKHWLPGMMMLAAIGAATLSTTQGHTQAAPPSGAVAKVDRYQSPKKVHTEDEGERVFQQNCARCHRVPDGFSPRITGTVVRHMRVRANLSQHDEQVLLRYFNQ